MELECSAQIGPPGWVDASHTHTLSLLLARPSAQAPVPLPTEYNEVYTGGSGATPGKVYAIPHAQCGEKVVIAPETKISPGSANGGYPRAPSARIIEPSDD